MFARQLARRFKRLAGSLRAGKKLSSDDCVNIFPECQRVLDDPESRQSLEPLLR